MKISITFFLVITAICHSAKVYSQVSDSLQLKNGKALTGTFLGWKNDNISFYVYDAGIISVNYGKVSMLFASSAKYHIETFAGKIYYDTLICLKPDEFVLTKNGNTVTIPFNSIELISPYKKELIRKGFVGLGYNYAQSNDIGLFAADGGLTITSEKWGIDGTVNSNFIHTKANGMQRNRESGQLRADRFINARWQMVARYTYQRNKELGLAYRHLVGGGLLYKVIRRRNLHLNFSSGLAGTAESTFDNQSYGRFEIPFLLEVTVSQLGSSNLTLHHTQFLFIGTGANRRIRHDGELRLNMQLTKKVSLSTYVFNNYDSAPVQKIGTNKLDYGWNYGLKFTL
jgi:hypothetical protein